MRRCVAHPDDNPGQLCGTHTHAHRTPGLTMAVTALPMRLVMMVVKMAALFVLLGFVCAYVKAVICSVTGGEHFLFTPEGEDAVQRFAAAFTNCWASSVDPASFVVAQVKSELAARGVEL
eukprot:TRINITY_DN10394_c0_g1_i1.p4 TRINITY_DN10394_c0_g1~~TRINITY_DN10394_c0_g1_i1.p4  ORF type:complete len:120 (+),score=24.61 TRINITY_DN10394_c0_g1_i1:582-941(+)